MKKKICGKETSEVKLKLNSSLYRNDRSLTFPVLLDNSLVQSINKQGMHVPIDEHLHLSALSSTDVTRMLKGGLSTSSTLEQSPMDNTVPLTDNSKSLPTFFPPRNQHVPPPPLCPSRGISKSINKFATDFCSIASCWPSGYFISEWSSFQISEKRERKLSLPLPALAGSQAWEERWCFLLEEPALIARHRYIGAAGRMDHLSQHERRNKIFAKESQKSNEELAKVQPKVTLLINFALMVLGHRN